LFEIVFVLLVLVLVLGLGSVALAGATAGRLSVDERRVRMVAVLAIIGALVTGFGVILFFASNWSEIARPLRVAVLLVGEVAFFAGGFYLAEVRRAYPHVAHALVFLGTLLFGASVFLVGQMYHVQAHDPLGFLLWSVAALAVAVLVHSGPIAALAILAFIAWTVHELIHLDEISDVDAARLLPVLLALLGSALYGFGTAAQPWLEPIRFARPLRILGYALAALGVFVLTFRFLHEGSIERAAGPGVVKFLLWGFAAAAFLGAAALLLRTRRRLTSLPEAVALAAICALALLAVYAGENSAAEWALLFNGALAVLALGAILVGLVNDEVWLANAGVVWVALDLVARFLDPEWSMLERATVFLIVGGVVLAGALALERRQALLALRR
jgi:uncharacterized membrane protein